MSGKYQENIIIRKINAASCASLALRFDIGSVFNCALASAVNRCRVRPRRSLTSLHAFRVEPIYCAAFAAARNECRVRPLRFIAPQFLFCKLFFFQNAALRRHPTTKGTEMLFLKKINEIDFFRNIHIVSISAIVVPPQCRSLTPLPRG